MTSSGPYNILLHSETLSLALTAADLGGRGDDGGLGVCKVSETQSSSLSIVTS